MKCEHCGRYTGTEAEMKETLERYVTEAQIEDLLEELIESGRGFSFEGGCDHLYSDLYNLYSVRLERGFESRYEIVGG